MELQIDLRFAIHVLVVIKIVAKLTLHLYTACYLHSMLFIHLRVLFVDLVARILIMFFLFCLVR